MKAKLTYKNVVFLMVTVLLYLAPSQASVTPLSLYDEEDYEVDGRKWTTPGPEPGSIQVTYSFMNYTPDISVAAQRAAIESAFQLWADEAPLWFIEVIDTGLPFDHKNATGENAGDIRILFAKRGHGDPYAFDGQNGVLAHAYYPPPNGVTAAGDAHFDEDETWTDMWRGTGSQPIDLLTVGAHEFGHSVGLGHSTISSALMYPYYSGSHRYLDSDDIAGIQAIYGSGTGGVIPIPEPNTLLLLASGLTAMGKHVRRRLRWGKKLEN